MDVRRTAMSARGAAAVTDRGASRPVRCGDFPAGATVADHDDPCRLPLVVKNLTLGADLKFAINDHLSISLRSAFIKDFHDLPNPFQMVKIGEIAVVANAFEMTSGKEISFKPSDLKAGRVVFYSDDVHPGQFLNFNNLPLYGPKIYAGGPVGVRVTIFELDIISEQGKGLLKSLASLGSLAYAPAAPVLAVLNNIGDGLLSSSQDDIEFRYVFVLDPKPGTQRVNNFALEAGNYVLVRSQDRKASIPWPELVLDENEGRLYRLAADGAREPYNDNTYVVLAINKNVGERDIDLDENTFTDLLGALKDEDRARAQRQAVVFDSLADALVERTRVADFSQAKRLLGEVRDAPGDALAQEPLIQAFTILSRLPVDDSAALRSRKSNEVPLSDDKLSYLIQLMVGGSITAQELRAHLWAADRKSPGDWPSWLRLNVVSSIRTNLKANL